MLEHIWYATFFLWIRDVQSGINADLTSFCFSIFVMRLCTSEMTSSTVYAYYCCSGLGRYEDVVSWELLGFVVHYKYFVVILRISDACSSVGNVSNFFFRTWYEFYGAVEKRLLWV